MQKNAALQIVLATTLRAFCKSVKCGQIGLGSDGPRGEEERVRGGAAWRERRREEKIEGGEGGRHSRASDVRGNGSTFVLFSFC